MNRKFIFIVSIISFICGLFSCETKRNVSFTEFKNGDRDSVNIFFDAEEVTVNKELLLTTKVRLKSKTTTVFTSKLYMSTNTVIDGKSLVLCFKQVVNTPISLRSLKQRKPYIAKNEGILSAKALQLTTIDGLLFNAVSAKSVDFGVSSIVLETNL